MLLVCLVGHAQTVDLKGQVETNVVSSNSNNVSTTTNNIFPSN